MERSPPPTIITRSTLPCSSMRQMGEHFGIGALVAAGDLDDVVQRHHPAVGDGVEDADVLVLALLVGQRLAVTSMDWA